jgi:hypothetical protein
MDSIDERDPKWVKSSYSTNGNCVEVARSAGDRIRVRDSKALAGPNLICGTDEWSLFIDGVKSGW